MSRAGCPESDSSGGRHLECAPNTRGRTPTYQQTSIAHRARLELAILPPEFFRAEPVTLPQCLARKGQAALWISFGIIDQPEFERIDLECVSQLVHRGLEREHATDSAGRTHPRWCVEICVGDLERSIEIRT